MKDKVIFNLADIADPGARAFVVEGEGGDKNGFVICYAGELRAYLNSCPHTGVTMNWLEDHFFDVNHKFVQCGMHGALFEPLSGLCIWGPCLGQSLQPLPLQLVDQQVIIYI